MVDYHILIIGGGNAAKRYVESLFWQIDVSLTICGMGVCNHSYSLSQEYGLGFINYSELDKIDINHFSCIIVTVPPEVKKHIVSFIVDTLSYKNALILEKPLCTSEHDFEYYTTLPQKIEKCSVVCQRDFDLFTYAIPESNNYNIIFPTFTSNSSFNLTHMMPHVLSWLFTTNNCPIYITKKTHNTYCGCWGNSNININFVNHNISDVVRINETVYPKVQFRKLNNNIFRKIMDYNQAASFSDIEKACCVSSIIIKLLNI